MMRKTLLALLGLLASTCLAAAGCYSGPNVSINQTASATGAAAQIVASITTTSSSVAYLTGVIITGGGATAGSTVNATITNVVGGPLNIGVAVPAGATTSITPIVLDFSACPIQGTAATITVTVPSFGAGSTLQDVIVKGF